MVFSYNYVSSQVILLFFGLRDLILCVLLAISIFFNLALDASCYSEKEESHSHPT
jgi:hypothetical protein